MKISLEWLKQYIDINMSAEELAEILPAIGHEVDGIDYTGVPPLDNVVVGEVVKKEQHPDADRLSVCEVQVGDGDVRQIVCGATNFKEGDRVPVALVGACLPGDFKIKKSKLRGVKSMGMMCSPTELGLGADAKGLLILEDRPEIGTPINEVFPETDAVLDVALTANRGDCASHVGIARELGAYKGLEVREPASDAIASLGKESGGLFKIESQNCPYYSAYKIQGVKIAPSPEWLQKLLTAIGLRPVNNVVDITNYVMLESGQPMHAFDAGKVKGALCIRQAHSEEKIQTLDDKMRTLDTEMMVIADDERPLVVAGVMGSIDAEVDDSTVDIILEVAYFNPANIRSTSRKLGLSTDSSYRFARDVDGAHIESAAKRALSLIIELAGGTLETASCAGDLPVPQITIDFDPHMVARVAGYEIPTDEVEEVLGALNFSINKENDDKWLVTVPSYRKDVSRPIDLVEEVIRLTGTDRIPESTVKSVGLSRKDDPLAAFNHAVVDYMTSQHFTEVMHYSLRSKDDPQSEVVLENPLTAEHTHLRGSLLPGLLEGVVLNQNNNTDPRRVFEVGRVFKEVEGVVTEYNAVAFALIEPQERTWTPVGEASFYTTKHTLLQLASLAKLDLESIGFDSAKMDQFQEGHSARVGSAAQLGLVDIRHTKSLGITGKVYAAELLLQPEHFKSKRERPRFKPFSQYPISTKDLAVIVDESMPAEAVRAELETVGAKVASGDVKLSSVSIFDVYRGKGLEVNQKSLAFGFKFYSPDRTLKDEEVMNVFDRLQEEVSKNKEFEVRS